MKYERPHTTFHCQNRGCDELESRPSSGRRRAAPIQQQRDSSARQAPAECSAACATSLATASSVRTFSVATPGDFTHTVAVATTARARNTHLPPTVRSRRLPASSSVAAPTERRTNGGAAAANAGEAREACRTGAGEETLQALFRRTDCRGRAAASRRGRAAASRRRIDGHVSGEYLALVHGRARAQSQARGES